MPDIKSAKRSSYGFKSKSRTPYLENHNVHPSVQQQPAAAAAAGSASRPGADLGFGPGRRTRPVGEEESGGAGVLRIRPGTSVSTISETTTS